ncbi:hypothetical protein [Streptomyces sp. NPDC055186]
MTPLPELRYLTDGLKPPEGPRGRPRGPCAERRSHPAAASAAPAGAAPLSAHTATRDAVAELLGREGSRAPAGPLPAGGAALLSRHPEAATALESLLTAG